MVPLARLEVTMSILPQQTIDLSIYYPQLRIAKQLLPLMQSVATSLGLDCQINDQLDAGSANISYVLVDRAGRRMDIEIDSEFFGIYLLNDHATDNQAKIGLLTGKLKQLASGPRLN
jgi:hypothetical protein